MQSKGKYQVNAERMMIRQLEKQLAGLFEADSARSPSNFNMEQILDNIG